MAAEITGVATEKLSGHQAGSRRYGTHSLSSDWDYGFEDNRAIRAFLLACGFKHETELKPGERVNQTAYFRHRHYNCEVFLCKNNEIKQLSTKIMRWFQWCEIMHHKRFRVRLWNALQNCLIEVWAVKKEYYAAKKRKDEIGFQLRNTPLS